MSTGSVKYVKWRQASAADSPSYMYGRLRPKHQQMTSDINVQNAVYTHINGKIAQSKQQISQPSRDLPPSLAEEARGMRLVNEHECIVLVSQLTYRPDNSKLVSQDGTTDTQHTAVGDMINPSYIIRYHMSVYLTCNKKLSVASLVHHSVLTSPLDSSDGL